MRSLKRNSYLKVKGMNLRISSMAQSCRLIVLSLINPPYGKSWKTDLERMGGKSDLKDPRFFLEYGDEPEYKMITRSSDGQEFVYHCRFRTRDQARAAVQEWIEVFYNRVRRHSVIGNVPLAIWADRFTSERRAA